MEKEKYYIHSIMFNFSTLAKDALIERSRDIVALHAEEYCDFDEYDMIHIFRTDYRIRNDTIFGWNAFVLRNIPFHENGINDDHF